jgi:hypothetical protein
MDAYQNEQKMAVLKERERAREVKKELSELRANEKRRVAMKRLSKLPHKYRVAAMRKLGY